MARLDVYANPSGTGYLLDCQADILDDLSTRFCVPLMPPDEAPLAAARLNPEFDLRGERLRMVTQFAGAVPARDLQHRVGDLSSAHHTIMNALDMLLTGY